MKKIFLVLILLISYATVWAQFHPNVMDKLIPVQQQSPTISLLVKGDVEKVKQQTEAMGGLFKYNVNDISSVVIPREKYKDFCHGDFFEQIERGYNRKPQVMMDQTKINNNITPVHSGTAPLTQAYDGNGVVVGVLDSGIDFNHPDFKTAGGQTRIQYIWSQTATTGGSTPLPYNYGKEWTAAQINGGTCNYTPDLSFFGHGSGVAGTATGNGQAVTTYRGVAPASDIIFCAIDFNGVSGNSFGTCVADAAQYCFAKAAAMGKPCVLNASLGEYGGSHDGTDLATQIIEGLLTAQSGRAFVAACGNGGGQYFHLGYNVPSVDSAYTWFKPFNYGGVYYVYYELYSDYADWNNVQFAFGADKVVGGYSHRKRSKYFSVLSDYQMSTQSSFTRYDTVRTNAGKRLGTIESYCEKQSGKYFMYIWVTLDSTNYNWSLITKGSGKFDVWSDNNFVGTSNMERTLPTVGQLADITKYALPDTEKTIVSGWNCSPKVISVGNYLNRNTYININNGTTNCNPMPVGKIFPSSSKGPSRTNLQKPDICASGEWTLAASDLYWINWAKINAPQNVSKDSLHGPLKGTSAASPVVAGIVALYLQKYPTATWSDIKTSMTTCVKTDAFTGSVPNYRYGYGKIDAFKMLNCKGCTTVGATNFNPYSQINDGSCIAPVGTPPNNDNLCSATNITAHTIGNNSQNNISNPNTTTINGSTTTATAQTFEPVPSCAAIGGTGARTVWYKLITPLCGNMTLNINTNQSGTNFNTVLAIYTYTGSCNSPVFTEIACNDDVSGSNTKSSITLTASQYTPGATYYIQVAGKSGVTGSFTLMIDVDAPTISANNATYGSIDIALPTVTNQYATRLRYTQAGSPGYADMFVTGLSTKTVNTLQSGTNYNFWTLYQCNPSGVEKYFSAAISQSTVAGCSNGNIADGPTVVPVSGNCHLVTVHWPPVTGALPVYGYRLYWQQVGNPGISGTTLSDTIFTLTNSNNLLNNVSYIFWYKAICTGNAFAVSPNSFYTTCPTARPASNNAADNNIMEHNGVYYVNMPAQQIPVDDAEWQEGKIYTVNFNSLSMEQYNNALQKELETSFANQNETLLLVPNPAGTTTSLRFYANAANENAQVTVMDMKGTTVFSSSLKIENYMAEMDMDLKNFTSGVYLVNVRTTKSNNCSKLVVLK